MALIRNASGGAQQQQPVGGFGTSSFGAAPTTSAPFGQPASSGFGQTGTGFGVQTTGGMGQASQPTPSGGTGFGSFRPSTTTAGFGSAQQPAAAPFGSTQPSTTGFGGFGSSSFGATNAPATGGFGSSGFGTTNAPPVAGATGGFGSTGFGATQPAAPTTSFGFGTGQSAANAPTAFGQPSNAPATTSFGAGFGSNVAQPAATPFGTTGQPAFGASTAPTQQSFGAASFGAPGTTSQPTFGAAATATQPAFGASAKSAAQAPSFSGFGATPAIIPATSAPSVAPLFGSSAAPSAQPTATGFSFGAKPASAAVTVPTLTAPATSFTAGTQPAAAPAAKPLFGATEASKPSFSFGAPATTTTTTAAEPAKTEGAKTSFTFGAAPAASVTTAATEVKPALPLKLPEASLPKPFEKEAAATEAPKPTVAAPPAATPAPSTGIPAPALPSVISFPSNLKNKNLGEIITSWNEELENLVSAFERQAVEIAQWDKRIVHNGEQIIALNDRVNKLEGLQKEVDQSLSYVVAQQTELENLLDGIERELPGLVQTVTGGKQSVVDAERDRMYASAETVQKQVIDVANQLSKMIYEINTTASDTAVPEGEMEGQPLVEIAQILNAHLDALQWIDHKVDELKQASVALKGQASKASSEMERFNHSTH